MRVLYVDVEASFLNPTRNLLPTLMARATNVRFFGPGYSERGNLKGGLSAFIRKEGPFAVVVVTPHVVFGDVRDRSPPDVHERHYALGFPARDLSILPLLAKELEDLRSLGAPLVGIFLESDYYNWTEQEIEAIDRRTDYAIGFGPEFWRTRSELPELGRESFAKSATDTWADWVRTNSARVASQLHFVGDGEFRWRPLVHRRERWCIPGIPYHARREARERLRRAGIETAGESALRRGMGALKKFGLVRREPRWVQHFLNSDHQDRLGSARFAYTCGSGLNMPVRKFFEIPAAGAVLVCRPFNGFEDAGFRHGENAFVCAPEDVVEAHRALSRDLAFAQRIADAGRRLVLEKHSVGARAVQLRETLAAMADGSFAGARWVAGQYVVARRSR